MIYSKPSSQYSSTKYIEQLLHESETLLQNQHLSPPEIMIRETNKQSQYSNYLTPNTKDDFLVQDRLQIRAKTLELTNPYYSEYQINPALAGTIKRGPGVLLDSDFGETKQDFGYQNPHFERRFTKEDVPFEHPLTMQNQEVEVFAEEPIEKIKQSPPNKIEINNIFRPEEIEDLERKVDYLGESMGQLKEMMNSDQKDDLRPKIEFLDQEIRSIKQRIVNHVDYDHRVIKPTSWCC